MSDTSHLNEEFAKAITELRQLYEATVDIKERLAVRRELNKLLRLYVFHLEKESSADDDAESETLAEVRQHLEPLGLAPEGTPLTELARLAALKLTEK